VRLRAFVLLAVVLLPVCFMTAVGVADKDINRKFNMSYIYFGEVSEHIARVKDAQGQIDEVAPSYFDLNSDGSLKLTDMYDKTFVDTMHSLGIRVVPFLSNHWNRSAGKAALARREELASEVAAAVELYNLDGVNVDIENMTEADRANYTDFVRLLREKLPDRCILAVAVAANPKGATTGWQGSYDYEALARYSDYLMIMAYDESYNESPPGPVASLNFVENSIKYALSKVPANKVVLGVPFYGRYWVNGKGGKGIGSVYVEELVKRYGGTTRFDNASKSSIAEVTIPKGSSFSIGYSSLGPGRYTIWFDNEQSLKQKLELVQKYNLKGTGSWSLGHEPGGTWDYYGLWLSGIYFADIQKHWARDFILSAYKKGWMKGTGTTAFLPDRSATRAQAATVLVRLLGLEAEEGPGTEGLPALGFVDTNGHWAQKEIETARYYGIVEGTGNNRFSPDRELTREQAAVMLDRIFTIESGAYSPKYFRDVNSEELTWSFTAITRMASVGLFNGFPDKTFRPYEPLTRAQVSVLLDRIWTLMEQGVLQITGVSS
jgi:spore germination protein YaaH